jgi:hypothetical protein
MKLELPQADFEAIHAAIDKTRRGSETVKVSRSALATLLRDHSNLIALHQGKVEDP